MAERDRPICCEKCGSTVQADDKFCGTCGSEVPTAAQDAAPIREVAGPSPAPQDASIRSRSRRASNWGVAVGALLVLLAGTGAVTYATLSPGLDLLGWSGYQPSSTEEDAPAQEGPKEEDPPTTNSETTQETTTTTASISPDAPPDPAFAGLLPTLQKRTTAPIMLPAELPSVLKNVAIDRDLEGDQYGIAFFREPPENVVEGWGRTEVYGTLQAAPENRSRSNEYFEATSVETIELPDGAQATLRRMEPVRKQGGTQGPFWEGRFEEGSHTYILTLLDDTSREMAAQMLSTMVEGRKRRGPLRSGLLLTRRRTPTRRLNPKGRPEAKRVLRRKDRAPISKPRQKQQQGNTTGLLAQKTGNIPTTTSTQRLKRCSPGRSGPRRTSGWRMTARRSTTYSP